MGTESVIVIGSGFGGAVAACRLAETGRHRVTVLERGRRYGRGDFPSAPGELASALWDPARGRRGALEHRRLGGAGVSTFTASGLGGGSLLYSGVLHPVPAAFFRGWPGGLGRDVLEPHYRRVLAMLEARPFPLDEPGSPYARTPKARLLEQAAERLGRNAAGGPAVSWERPPLGLTFGPRPGEERVNRHGARQSACTGCGRCNLGCNEHAKNSLDLNYLRRAAEHGAELRTGAEVDRIAPRSGGGYLVRYGEPGGGGERVELACDRVILAAGSLGSTELLLRQRRLGSLANLSPALGRRWSPNGDLLALCLLGDQTAEPTVGPVITGSIRFQQGDHPDGFPHGLYVQDGGLPEFLGWYLAARTRRLVPLRERWRGLLQSLGSRLLGTRERSLVGAVGESVDAGAQIVRRALPLLGMGRDRSTGELSLGGRGPGRLRLAWSARASRLHFERTREALARVAEALGAPAVVENPLSLLGRHVTVHPLGGCGLADAAAEGVVSARTAEVFGHPGLHVLDGSILPTSVGPNPSLTIAALAEHFVEPLT